MPRSGEDARRRLQQAALELFQERGYDAVTAAEIAARAGVTERTFFRHFKDKREVLFDGEEAFRDAWAQAVERAPPALEPVEAILFGLSAVKPMLQAYRAVAATRHAVVAANPALRERMAAKTSGLIEALSQALQRRGVAPALTGMSAQLGMALFAHAMQAWSIDPDTDLEAHLARAAEALRGLAPKAVEA